MSTRETSWESFSLLHFPCQGRGYWQAMGLLMASWCNHSLLCSECDWGKFPVCVCVWEIMCARDKLIWNLECLAEIGVDSRRICHVCGIVMWLWGEAWSSLLMSALISVIAQHPPHSLLCVLKWSSVVKLMKPDVKPNKSCLNLSSADPKIYGTLVTTWGKPVLCLVSSSLCFNCTLLRFLWVI